MYQPGRKYDAGSVYRYGFNGQEKSNELGEGFTTAEFWEYDSRIGRRWNLDPIFKESESPYSCFSDNPIFFSDPKGDSIPVCNRIISKEGTLINVPTVIDLDIPSIDNNPGAYPGFRRVGPHSFEITPGNFQASFSNYFNSAAIVVKQNSNGLFTIDPGGTCVSGDKPVVIPEPIIPITKVKQNEPPVTGTREDISWRFGTYVDAKEQYRYEYFRQNLNLTFAENTSTNSGTDFENKPFAITEIVKYASILKLNGVKNITVQVNTTWESPDKKAHGFDRAADLIEARQGRIAGYCKIGGISVSFKEGTYGIDRKIYAWATKPIKIVTGYNVSTTPVKQKLINGIPSGKAISTGATTNSNSVSKPKTGLAF